MDPMFLPDVEKAVPGGLRGMEIKAGKALGLPIPQILHLFAFKPDRTKHLMSFTQEVMRGPSPLSAGMRELIAGFVSKANDCLF
ncbi:MAG: peroxidase [Planctomycetes bacterium]|nr:peroxidase [Planctomycetota bacterium]